MDMIYSFKNQNVHEAAVSTPRTCVDLHTNAGLTQRLWIIHGGGAAARRVSPADNKEQVLSNQGGCILMSH